MASGRGVVDFILEQIAAAGPVSARAMFGEYALFCGGKLFGLVCDDQLYLKPTRAGRAVLGPDLIEARPYPAAKPCFLVAGDRWEQGDWLAELVRVTVAELPLPKPKTARKRATAPR